jgi:hypothetical protein
MHRIVRSTARHATHVQVDISAKVLKIRPLQNAKSGVLLTKDCQFRHAPRRKLKLRMIRSVKFHACGPTLREQIHITFKKPKVSHCMLISLLLISLI